MNTKNGGFNQTTTKNLYTNGMPTLFQVPDKGKTVARCSANSDTIFSNSNYLRSVAIDFNGSKMTTLQDTGESYFNHLYHSFRLQSISNIKVELFLNAQALIDRYFDGFAKQLKDAAQNPVFQLGYFYNGKLMFTQNTYDQSDLLNNAALKSGAGLKNVSLQLVTNDNPSLKQIQQIGDADSEAAIQNILETLTQLEPASASEAQTTLLEDPVRQLFTYVRLLAPELSGNTPGEATEKFATKTHYDPSEKGLSVSAAAGGLPASALKKVFNIFVGNNLNPGLTDYLSPNQITKNGIDDALIPMASYAAVADALKKALPKVAKVGVFYNLLGEKIIRFGKTPYDSTMFDSLELMESNIRVIESAAAHDQSRGIIDKARVFVINPQTGAKTLVLNKVSDIYRFEMGGQVKYFRAMNDLRSYLQALVEEESTGIE